MILWFIVLIFPCKFDGLSKMFKLLPVGSQNVKDNNGQKMVHLELNAALQIKMENN